MTDRCFTVYTSHQSDPNSATEKRTRVIDGPENALKVIQKSLNNTKKRWCACVEKTVPAISIGKKLWPGYQDARARGVKIKYVTEITKENSKHCKKIMKVAELRHMAGIAGSFAVSESEYVSAYKRSAGSPLYDQLIYSNVKEIVAQQQNAFDVFWNSAVPAVQKIREIEERIEVPRIEPMLPADAARLAWKHMESAAKEILVIFPSAESFNLAASSSTGTALWKKVMEKGNIKFNILVPRDDVKVVETVRQIRSDIPEIEIRMADSLLKSKMLFLMIDGRHLFMWEPAKQDQENVSEARGSSMYSNSAPLVSSCVSIFESLLRQTYLYEHIRHVNEQLEIHNKMQQEFINIAAHELRTPIQPILVTTSLWKDNPVKNGRVEVAEEQIAMITRNAVRLQRLSSDILDVARIESQNLELNRKKVNLTEIISDVVKDASQFADDNIEFQLNGIKDNVYVEADKVRLTQVLTNLVNNAIRFTGTAKNTISISVDTDGGEKSDVGAAVVKVIVRDTGRGIDAEIMPRLFTRFASKTDSGTGTGLGLYISKKIIEAHGGRIWAENNKDGNGATFTFTLSFAGS